MEKNKKSTFHWKTWEIMERKRNKPSYRGMEGVAAEDIPPNGTFVICGFTDDEKCVIFRREHNSTLEFKDQDDFCEKYGTRKGYWGYIQNH